MTYAGTVSKKKIFKASFVTSPKGLKFVALVATYLAIFGCDKFSQKVVSDQREGLIEGVGKAKAVEVTSDPSSGVLSAKISANSPFTQEIRAASDGPLKGTVLSFPPGALKIDTEIAVEESVPLASASIGAALGINGSLTKSSAAIAVLPQTATDPAQAFTVAITLSNPENLRLTAENLVVLYKVKIFAENKTLAGIIPTSAITVDGNTVKFLTQYFGAFQAAYSSVPVTEEKKIEVSVPVQPKREIAPLPPVSVSSRSTFVVRPSDTVTLSGQNFRPTMTLALGTTLVKDMRILSDTSVSFSVPTTSSSGVLPLTVDQDGTSQTVALFYSSAPLTYPVSTFSPSDVCQGTVYYDGTGRQVSGTKTCVVEGCSATKTTDCVASDNFPAVDKANLPVEKIRSGTTIAARAGTLANCAEGDEGCVAVLPFRAASTTNLASKIVANSTVAGVSGNVTLPLEQDVRINIQYGVNGTGRTGNLSVNNAPSDCNAADQIGCVTTSSFPSIDPVQIVTISDRIRIGTTIASVGGQLKTNCRNSINSSLYSTQNNTQDTIDDSTGWSATQPTAWSLETLCDSSTWSDKSIDASGNPAACGASTTCIYQDKISNLLVTNLTGSDASPSPSPTTPSSWADALQACASSTIGGSTAGTWRLPTQKELMSIYEHGIASIANDSYFISLTTMKNAFWSATTYVDTTPSPPSTDNAWTVTLASGNTIYTSKTSTNGFVCVK